MLLAIERIRVSHPHTHLLQVRITSNLKALTVEELQGSKRAMHLVAFDYANAETTRTLELIKVKERAEERLQRDPHSVFPVDPWLKAGGKEENLVGCRKENGYVTFNVQALLGKLRRDCEAVRARHATATVERFAVDGDYRAIVGEMLDTDAAAVCSLRWYLEDPNLSCAELLYTSLITGHKRYLGYLARTRAWCGNALCYSLCGDT